jgi:hypothetical protein
MWIFSVDGMICIVLLYELCPRARSIVFVSSSMYDEVSRLASKKYSEECPYILSWCTEMVRQIYLVMLYSNLWRHRGL